MIYTPLESFKDYAKKNHPELEFTPIEKAKILVLGSYHKDDFHANHDAIFVPFTGTNQIDLAFIRSKNILLFNTQAHARYVAERALALILTLMGTIIPYHEGLKEGFFSHRNSEERIPWVSVYTKKIGFLGYGAINQELHKLLTPFHVDVYALARGKTHEGVTRVSNLDELAKTVDVLVGALPLTKQTEGLIDARILSSMKDSFLINVGRGPVIDEKAVYDALINRTLRGFASDVWWQYPKKDERMYPSKYPIHTLKNVVMTPHSGGYTVTALDERFSDTVSQIKAYLKGDTTRALDVSKLLKYEG